MALRSIAAFVAALCAYGVTAIHADVCEPLKVGIHLRVDQSIASGRFTGPLKDESVLRTVRPSMGGLVRDHELARALGRVLAHEIGHVLLGALYHDRAGLMRAAFRPDELAEPNGAPFHLTRNSVDRLRSRLPALTRRESSDRASCIAFQPAR